MLRARGQTTAVHGDARTGGLTAAARGPRWLIIPSRGGVIQARARQPNGPRLGTPEQLEVANQLQILQQFQVSHDGGVRGVDVYAALIDTRSRKPRIYASSCNPLFGMKILRSDDIMGRRWRPSTC